jgi:hypothetical protein
MKPSAAVIPVPIVILSLLGCSGNTQQATEVRSTETKPLTEKRSPETPALTEEDILAKARSEILKLGVTDERMMQMTEEIGFEPKVTPFDNGWKVAHPIGHPWAVAWIHLEMDSEGNVLQHYIEPGE